MKTFTLDGHTIECAHEDKVLFPETGITKGELADYYERIAPLMLPHVRERQLTVQRFPNGIGQDGFYQKHRPDYYPAWIGRHCVEKKDDGDVCYVVADSAAALVYLAAQDAIVYHLGLSRIDKVHYPDRLIFDLDPSIDDWSAVCVAAKTVRGLLEDELGLKTFVMTTGSRGVHIVVPLDRTADFDATKAFAREVAELLASRHPETLTTEVRKDKRAGKVFIDYLRNAYGQTGVAPYSVRARANASVATPLEWSEIKPSLSADFYTIKTMFKRLARKDDPWHTIDVSAQGLKKAAAKLSSL